jgi:hypothetical protein
MGICSISLKTVIQKISDAKRDGLVVNADVVCLELEV